MFDATFFVALSFFVFVIAAYKPIGRFLAGALDKRARSIEETLADAVRLRDEAQSMLSAYEKKYNEIEQEAEAILDNARASAKAMQEEASAALQRTVQARLAAAQAKIRRAEALAVQETQRQIVDVALAAAREVVREKMQKETDDKLIELAINDVDRIIH